jgi:hypothetical protein
MEILKCNAEFGKVYYVGINNTLHQCKLIRTESHLGRPSYVLDVAQRGEVRIEADRQRYFDKWYRTNEIPSILYKSVEDYRNHKPIIDNYGSTSNCFNSKFIEPLFTRCSTCNCGGGIYTWRWNGCKAVCYLLTSKEEIGWSWDVNGFHCSLNYMRDSYRTKRECEESNQMNIVTF